jgi:hypothetical protein
MDVAARRNPGALEGAPRIVIAIDDGHFLKVIRENSRRARSGQLPPITIGCYSSGISVFSDSDD